MPLSELDAQLAPVVERFVCGQISGERFEWLVGLLVRRWARRQAGGGRERDGAHDGDADALRRS